MVTAFPESLYSGNTTLTSVLNLLQKGPFLPMDWMHHHFGQFGQQRGAILPRPHGIQLFRPGRHPSRRRHRHPALSVSGRKTYSDPLFYRRATLRCRVLRRHRPRREQQGGQRPGPIPARIRSGAGSGFRQRFRMRAQRAARSRSSATQRATAVGGVIGILR